MSNVLSPEAVAQMVADREAGTPWPWQCHFGDETTTCNCKYILADYGGMGSIATIDVCEVMDGIWGDDIGPPVVEAKANASRIARLPDLEAAYLTLAAENATLRASEAAAIKAVTDALAYIDKGHPGMARNILAAALAGQGETP